MILDAQQLYSDAQALSATAASTNIIDHGNVRDLGAGEELALVITLDVAADQASADETYVAALQTDDNTGFSSPTQIGGSITIPRGSAAGTMFILMIPPNEQFERYTRVNFTLGGTTPSVTLTAFLIPARNIQLDKTYADAIVIS